MGCSSCSSGTGTPGGCGDKGACSTGSCNKLNTFDWLANIELPDYAEVDIIEVSFKNGAHKEFFRKPSYLHIVTGEHVAVESSAGGYDIGRVSLMGELVRLQMKKKRVKANSVLPNVLRQANERDIERLQEARDSEKETMIRARAIARSLNLDMKIGDVEFQGDKRKATFYYTADGRVDFRELIRVFAREFKVKIEMRQIGARQESALIGGLGPCGRELCCSTWLSDFKSVSTAAARYQNLAINQSKLSGQCGRLKCCLNYELNTYLDALQEFPRNVEVLRTEKGIANLVKTDIFKRIMFFAYRKEFGAMEFYPLSIERVREIADMNKKGKKPADLLDEKKESNKRSNNSSATKEYENANQEFVDGTGVFELSQLEDKKRKKRRKKKPQGPKNQEQGTGNTEGPQTGGPQQKKEKQVQHPPKKRQEGPRNNQSGGEEKKANEEGPKEGNNQNQNKKRSNNRNKKRKPRPKNNDEKPNADNKGNE